MKKLAIITTHPIQYQIPLFKLLKNKNIDANVFFASKQGIKSKFKDPEFLIRFKWEIESNLLHGFKSFFPKKQKYRINDFRLAFEDLEMHIKNKKFDAILILGWNNLHYLKAIYYAKKYNIKIIFRCENNLEAKNSVLKKILKFFILKLLFRNFDYFLSIGKLNKNFYAFYKVDQKRIFDAPYFVNNNFFNKKINKKKIQRKFKLNSKKIVLFVGKFIDRKRPYDFIELAKLNQNNKNILFLMIGDGILKKDCIMHIRKQKLKNIHIKGFVNQSELREIYKISHLLIQTSTYETWGLTINEAMASGIPVLCTLKCGAYHDLIKNKKTGMSYDVGNIIELNNKMNFMLKNYFKFKKSDIKKVISSYSAEKTINSIKKILYDTKI